MFCTKCGKKLHDGDIFCAHCGNKVRNEANTETDSRYSDIVFNPPFKMEAQRRTEEISQEVKQYSREPKRERVEFNWNLSGFPGSKPKTDEDFAFNWDDVIEKNRRTREVDVEKIVPQADSAAIKTEETIGETVKQEEPKQELFFKAPEEDSQALSIEELERELFGEAPSRSSADAEKELEMTLQYKKPDLEEPTDRFKTFNAKRDAFQELLDKERRHIEELDQERKAQWESIAPAEEQAERSPKEPPAFEDVFIEPELMPGGYLKEVDVALPPQPVAVMADEEDELAAGAEEIAEEPILEEQSEEKEVAEEKLEGPATEETEADSEPTPFQAASGIAGSGEQELEHQEKAKLRYSDVFPAESVDIDGGSSDSTADDSGETTKDEQKIVSIIDEDDDDEDNKKKGNPFLKALIAILIILVAAELVIIGIKIAAPESEFAKKIDGLMLSVTNLFGGGQEEPQTEDPSQETKTTYISDYINAFAAQAVNIGTVSEAAELKYDLTKTYAFEEIGATSDFENGPLDTSGDSTITVAQGLIENVITYYNALKDNNLLAEGVVGVNTLEIGEIRTGDSGYYILNKVTYAKEAGGELVQYETVHLTVAEGVISVGEVKEETL